jgi:hypothetical protein
VYVSDSSVTVSLFILYPESEPPTAVVPEPLTPPTVSVLSKSIWSIPACTTIYAFLLGASTKVSVDPEADQTVPLVKTLTVGVSTLST